MSPEQKLENRTGSQLKELSKFAARVSQPVQFTLPQSPTAGFEIDFKT